MKKIFSSKKMYAFTFIITAVAFLIILTTNFQSGPTAVKPTGQFLPYIMLRIISGQILPIFIIILVIDMFTKELQEGTFKITLVHPISRNKYLITKVITLILLISILLFFTMGVSYIIGTLTFGWGETLSINHIDYNTINGIIKIVSSYLITILPLSAFGLMVIVLSLILKTSGVAVGLSIGLLFILDIIRQLFPKLSPYVINHAFMAFENITMTNLLNTTVLVLGYSLVSLFASQYILNRKEIVN
jgi:ABC-2 type transport system permease protein